MSEKHNEKKRKRQTGGDERPSKKPPTEVPAQTVKVSVLKDTNAELGPVIVTAPGLKLPPNTSFTPYTRARANKSSRLPPAGNPTMSSSELLLHSSKHPKLDYIAREEDSGAADSLLRHYVGVYEPGTGKLQIVQARKLIVRGNLRSDRSAATADGVEQQQGPEPTTLSARSVLGQTFGTKKSQKAIRALTENAITSSPLKSSQDPSQRPKLGAAASAVIESMAQSSASMPSREDLQAAVDEGKPRPKPNLEAQTPAEVYTVEGLVELEILKQLVVREWQDKVNKNEDVKTTSRFVSERLVKTVKTEDVKRLKALRYLLLLMDWSTCLRAGARNSKKLPGRDDVKKAVGSEVGDGILESVMRRFTMDGTLNKWYTDNLMTHICALVLTIDNYEVDIYDLREDLKLDVKTITRYFHELGCRVTPLTEAERSRLNLTKAEAAAAHRIARLKLPLEFPKNRIMASGKRR